MNKFFFLTLTIAFWFSTSIPLLSMESEAESRKRAAEELQQKAKRHKTEQKNITSEEQKELNEKLLEAVKKRAADRTFENLSHVNDLLEKGADPNYLKTIVDPDTEYEYTWPIREALLTGDIADLPLIALLLNTGANPDLYYGANDQDEDPRALDHAIYHSNINLIKLLLEKGSEANIPFYIRTQALIDSDTRGKINLSPLYIVLDRIEGEARDYAYDENTLNYFLHWLEALQLLLNSGADPNGRDMGRAVEPRWSDPFQESVWPIAHQRELIDKAVRLLISYGAHIIDAKQVNLIRDSIANPIEQNSALGNSKEIESVILPNTPAATLDQALIYAVGQRHKPIVLLLLEKGASPLEALVILNNILKNPMLSHEERADYNEELVLLRSNCFREFHNTPTSYLGRLPLDLLVLLLKYYITNQKF